MSGIVGFIKGSLSCFCGPHREEYYRHVEVKLNVRLVL